MEITGVKTAQLGGSSAVIKIDTDEGIAGVGEAVVETVPTAVLNVVERFADESLLGVVELGEVLVRGFGTSFIVASNFMFFERIRRTYSLGVR